MNLLIYLAALVAVPLALGTATTLLFQLWLTTPPRQRG